MKITKEQVIYCIYNFANPTVRVDLIRAYCLEKGKQEFETELFLQACRDINTKWQMLYMLNQIPFEPKDLFIELSNFIIQEKSREFVIIHLFYCNNNLLLIY